MNTAKYALLVFATCTSQLFCCSLPNKVNRKLIRVMISVDIEKESKVKKLLTRHENCITAILDDTRNSFGMTPLQVVAHHGKDRLVKILLDAGANPNKKNNQGMTALHYAAGPSAPQINTTTVIRQLIAAGGEVNAKSDIDETPLCASLRHIKNVRLLIAAGANVNQQSRYGNVTPLIKAAFGTDAAVVRALILAGAIVSSKDFAPHIPLLCATSPEYYDGDMSCKKQRDAIARQLLACPTITIPGSSTHELIVRHINGSHQQLFTAIRSNNRAAVAQAITTLNNDIQVYDVWGEDTKKQEEPSFQNPLHIALHAYRKAPNKQDARVIVEQIIQTNPSLWYDANAQNISPLNMVLQDKTLKDLKDLIPAYNKLVEQELAQQSGEDLITDENVRNLAQAYAGLDLDEIEQKDAMAQVNIQE